MDQSANSTDHLGLHYYPDTEHYRQQDIERWLPRLRSLGASWVTLKAPLDRAIPEDFLSPLIADGIEPVLHFDVSLIAPPQPGELRAIYDAYCRWGVRYVALFDRPNCHSSWATGSWARRDLVERFLDIYIPLAKELLDAGLTPVFPPLEPGGDYWDTAFLQAALGALQDRGEHALLKSLVLGAYAWAGNRPLNWGAGGPERWPGARPYYTPDGEQDQIGFRIFDWYNTIAQTVLSEPLPILILAGGASLEHEESPDSHAQHNLALAKLLAGQPSESADGEALESVPANVLACNFWLLAAEAEHPDAANTWYRASGEALPIVSAMQANFARPESQTSTASTAQSNAGANGSAPVEVEVEAANSNGHAISHYLLLPSFDWGVSEWHLHIIRPFVKRYRPTVGYSLEEATHADRVTVVDSSGSFSTEALDQLRAAGCTLDCVAGDGIRIATQLASM